MPDAPLTSQVVGPSGGTVQAPGGPTLVIPANAVDHDTTITITLSLQAAPDGSLTPAYEFGPEGTVFAQPVTVTFPVPGGTQGASIYWSKHGGGGFERIGGTITGTSLSAQVTHFSSGYVAPTAGGRTLSGTEIATYIRPGGITNQGFDLSTLGPNVYVPDGNGGFTMISGTGATDGTFAVENVPDGDVYLQLGTEYYLTSATAFDAGYEVPGRPDAISPATTTSITLNLTGLDPWAAGDNFEAYSAESDTWYFFLEQTYPPANGAMTLTTTFNNGDGVGSRRPPLPTGVHLVQASKGDNLSVAQLTQRQTTEGTTYSAMTKYFNTSSLEQTDGSMSTVSGAFTDVSASNTLTVQLLATQYDGAAGWDGSHALAMNPNAVPNPLASGTELSVLGIPGGSGYGEYSNSADFLYVQLPIGASDTMLSNMTYGTPAAGTWAAIADVRDSFVVPVLATGTTNPGNIPITIGMSDEVTHLAASPVGCSVTPVRSPTVAGRDAWTAQTGVGLTPVIAWQGPQSGPVTYYHVAIWKLSIVNGGAKTRPVYVGSVQTTGTSVQLPPGLLATGNQYVAEINANHNANPSTNSPNRFRLPSHHAEILTQPFSP